jgi:hypothetical protein
MQMLEEHLDAQAEGFGMRQSGEAPITARARAPLTFSFAAAPLRASAPAC